MWHFVRLVAFWAAFIGLIIWDEVRVRRKPKWKPRDEKLLILSGDGPRLVEVSDGVAVFCDGCFGVSEPDPMDFPSAVGW